MKIIGWKKKIINFNWGNYLFPLTLHQKCFTLPRLNIMWCGSGDSGDSGGSFESFPTDYGFVNQKEKSNNIVLLFHFVSRFVIGYGLGYYGKGFFRAHLSNNHSVISSFRISVNIISTQQKELNNREYQRIRWPWFKSVTTL